MLFIPIVLIKLKTYSSTRIHSDTLITILKVHIQNNEFYQKKAFLKRVTPTNC